MSDLHRKLFKKGGKPPVDPNAKNEEMDEELEETKDAFE